MNQDYPHFHQDRGNMLIHIVAVPAFIYGTWLVISGVMAGRWLGAVFGLAAMDVWIAQMANPITGGNKLWEAEASKGKLTDREKIRLKTRKDRKLQREAEKKAAKQKASTTETIE